MRTLPAILTVLDDGAAGSIQTIAVSGAPWTGSFQPAQPLSTFNGQTGGGTWVLNVSDNASFDIGSVRAVSLKLNGFDCSP